MTNQEIQQFIESMEEIGDIWQAEDVRRVYGNTTLKEALTDRHASVDMFMSGISKAISHTDG